MPSEQDRQQAQAARAEALRIEAEAQAAEQQHADALSEGFGVEAELADEQPDARAEFDEPDFVQVMIGANIVPTGIEVNILIPWEAISTHVMPSKIGEAGAPE